MQIVRRPTRYVVLLALAISVCAGPSAAASQDQNASSSARLLVKFRSGTSTAAKDHALVSVGAHLLRSLRSIRVDVLQLSSGDIPGALARLRASRLVAYAEPDALLQPQELLPNDPSFPRQFAVVGGAWGWYTTHTTQAWDITRGDPSVVVAILDTGLKTQGLADYDGQVVTGWDVMRNSTDTSSYAGNHGTYVAGVVGLALNNGVGNAGYCPGCKVMPVQVGTDSGAYLSDIATGLTWAASHGARVANMSWAGTSSSSTLTDAVAYARSKGLVVTAAAGNSNCDCPTYPAATPGVIGVAGTNDSDTKEGNSNFGSWVKVAAPEGNLTGWPSINGAPGYAPAGGTSLAAPVVAAVAGLLFSANPALTGTQVEQALESSAAPMTFVQFGRVDALAALNYLGFADPQPAAAPANLALPQVLVETNGVYNTTTLAGSPQVGQVLLRGQGSWTGSTPLSLRGVEWQRCGASGSTCTTVATTASYTVQTSDTGFALRLQIAVSNGIGSNTAVSALTGVVGGAVSTAPPVDLTAPTISGTAQEGRTLTALTGSWSGSTTGYSYEWRRCDSSGANCAALAGATASSYSVQTTDVGSTLRVAVTASNAGGASTAISAASSIVAAAVAPAPSTQTTTFSGSLNLKNPSKTFNVAVGGGATHAELSFSKCVTLTLGLSNQLSATGPSIVTLDTALTAGTYTYIVSGGRCSFTLTVTSPAP